MEMIKLPVLIFCLSFFSCGQRNTSEKPAAKVEIQQASPVPVFNGDSAYTYVANQVAFGPRVPNTSAHVACGDYLISELKRFGAEVYVQETILTAFDKTRLNSRNIIGAYNPDSKKRVLLFAHWDSRPFADEEKDAANHHTPIDGADDGASGVGVLLEIARNLGQKLPDIGIDIIFFDAEDYGTPSFMTDVPSSTSWWCLGSQFWAKNPHVRNYNANYGILLDMAGAKDAVFYKEYESQLKAAPVLAKVWATARSLGYGRFFINATGGSVLDDHLFVMAGRRIPCIDIINLDPNNGFSFRPYWHTLNDTMENIDRETLTAVGQTVMAVIYNEK